MNIPNLPEDTTLEGSNDVVGLILQLETMGEVVKQAGKGVQADMLRQPVEAVTTHHLVCRAFLAPNGIVLVETPSGHRLAFQKLPTDEWFVGSLFPQDDD